LIDIALNKSQDALCYLSPQEIARRLGSDPALLVCDVRNPDELRGELGELSGAVNIPLGQLEQRVGELSAYKRRDIVASLV